MNPINDLAEVDTEYRCVMKYPQKKFVLKSVPSILRFWFGAMDGIGATRSACAFRRAGGVAIVYRREIVWVNFSNP